MTKTLIAPATDAPTAGPVPKATEASIKAHILLSKLFLYHINGHFGCARATPNGNGCSHPCSLASDGASHHITHGRMGAPVTCNSTACYKQVFNVARHEAAIGHLEVTARGREDQDVVAIYELREDTNRVRKPRL
eukprot:CAMPEP_0172892766 /NCGR_PEP_ID=MMETSP1075-20121228/146905_1 /TAXON_ID=2916 /ORGANISM="Ceratium fusus, Strain PA161109" /LENGTH=134 /DNA_ID=CAMNT_0013747491 /DNA_START=305 /DNA_END=706 /DNA_ORIENTATION=+